MPSIASLSPSHLAYIANAPDREQATHMNLIDRIIDFFRGGVKREAIEKAFESIALMKKGFGSIDEGMHRGTSDSLNDAQRLDKLCELRSWALPEQRHQFKFDIFPSENGTFGITFNIAGVEVYRNDDIYESMGSGETAVFFGKKFQMDLEDAARLRDPGALVKTLAAIHNYLDDHMPTRGPDGEELSAERLQEESLSMIRQLIADIPSDAKAMLYKEATSDFGNRFRGVLEFGRGAGAARASQTHATVPVPDMDTPSIELTGESNHVRADIAAELQFKLTAMIVRFAEVLTICAETPDVHLDDPLLGLPARLTSIDTDDNSRYDEMESLPFDKIATYQELTAAEAGIFPSIGIPDAVLRSA